VSLYSIRYAQHGKDLIRVAHDEVLRWYMSLDGKKWTPVDRHTLKSAMDHAHSCLHRASEKCSERLQWNLDKSTQAKVLGECPRCANPSMESDLTTFRSCPDCGWRIDFTKAQKARTHFLTVGCEQTRHSDTAKSDSPSRSGLRSSDGSPRAESGELFMRSEVVASMDLVATIGHLSGALQRLRRRASTSCYPTD